MSRKQELGLMAVVAVLAIVCFAYVLLNLPEVGQPPTPDTTIERTEIPVIYAPAALIEICKKQKITSREQLKQLAEEGGIGKAWFAVVFIDHESTGKVSRHVYTFHTVMQMESFAMAVHVLETLGGRPPVGEKADYRRTRIAVIPPDLVEKKPVLHALELMQKRD